MKRIQTKKALKLHNQQAVLNLLRKTGSLSIPEIASEMRLSNNTVIKIIEHYLETGLVINIGKGESTYDGGKKPNLFAFNPHAKYAIGMRFAHEGKLHGVLTDLSGAVVIEASLELPWNTPSNELLNKIGAIKEELINRSSFSSKDLIGIAIGTHGITNFETGVIIRSPHNPAWGENLELKKMVQTIAGDETPIYVDNQIRFQAYAEKIFGAAKDFENIIVLRSGFSAIAGIISENSIKRGKNSLLGSIGHMTLDPHDDEICMCGGKGCFGVLVHQSRIEREAGQLAGQFPESVLLQGRESGDISINDIFKASNHGDRLAISVMDRAIEWFARGIHNIIIFYDPEIIIIQGKYSEAGPYFIANLKKKVNEVSLLGVPLEVKIEYSSLGAVAGDIGAAAYAIEEYFNSVLKN